MGRIPKLVEPTIWALRKNAKTIEEAEQERQASLYEHIFGYEPIVVSNTNKNVYETKIRRGSAENPKLNILNPATNFMVMEMAADLPADEK